ncbi:hypothetical protein J2S74_000029 [Evansella vedderi]|uniref:NADH dehydrogenase subunit 6 n=1 Tax=Evansella vedderi TaxID=38282 RepID=A0ABT9ZPM1_9BACI|nr:hypothetical protein [Evansella vedderi]MDQ0252657.1 hypothetical protein [Evansella vedderi]
MKRHLTILLLITVPFSLVNYNVKVMKTYPEQLHGAASILFLLFLFTYCGFVGWRRGADFIKFLTAYWGAGAFLCLLGFYGFIAPIYYPAEFIYSVPVYGGVRYFFGSQPSIGLVMYIIITSYAICCLGYLLGRQIRTN